MSEKKLGLSRQNFQKKLFNNSISINENASTTNLGNVGIGADLDIMGNVNLKKKC